MMKAYLKNTSLFALSIFFIFLTACADHNEKITQLIKEGDLLHKAGHYEQAIIKFESAYTLGDPSSTLYFNLGASHFEIGDIETSITYFQQAIDKNPANYEALGFMGQAYNRIKAYDKAQEALHKSLKIHENASSYFILGMIHFNLEDYQQALEYHNKAISIKSTDSDFYIKRAATYMSLENYHTAIKDSNTALKLNHTDTDAYFLKALCYQYIGDMASACENFIKINELEPGSLDEVFLKDCQQ